MNFDYFYGRQAEQFAFYQIPKILITDDRFAMISTDAKLLYTQSLPVQHSYVFQKVLPVPYRYGQFLLCMSSDLSSCFPFLCRYNSCSNRILCKHGHNNPISIIADPYSAICVVLVHPLPNARLMVTSIFLLLV